MITADEMFTPPSKAELDDLIATLKKTVSTWKSNPGYKRQCEVELFCVMAYRDRVYGMPIEGVTGL